WTLLSMPPLAQTLALLAMAVATVSIQVVPLDMAQKSFDDQYLTCAHDMAKKLPELNSTEFLQNAEFAQVWPKARAAWQAWGTPVTPLSQAQAIALMICTMKDVHRQFNMAFDDEVRVARRSPQQYQDKFHFKALHFLLTDALATLRDFEGRQCRCVFRGVDQYKFKANVGDIVRFGKFVLSLACHGDIESSQSTTVFRVSTCHSADITTLLVHPKTDVVLIPPFEQFKVTDVIEDGEKVQIHLDSMGTYSKYNCQRLTGEDTHWGHG
ncbi:NRT2 ribosyltransferase, partial [Erithacus rubecula]|nr:NRT2 ribosyltransferase [Erithacus rubecula]